MRGPALTQAMIVAATLAIVVFDILVGTTYGGEATISAVVLNWSKVQPRLIFALGFLLGHLFVDQLGIAVIDRLRARYFFTCKELPELMGLTYFLLALIPWPARWPLLALICGVLAGYFCWPQSAELGR